MTLQKHIHELPRFSGQPDSSIFRFGPGSPRNSLGTLEFTCRLGTLPNVAECLISTSVVDGDVPLLLGRDSLLDRRATLDLAKLQMTHGGTLIDIQDSNGHFLCEFPVWIAAQTQAKPPHFSLLPNQLAQPVVFGHPLRYLQP